MTIEIVRIGDCSGGCIMRHPRVDALADYSGSAPKTATYRLGLSACRYSVTGAVTAGHREAEDIRRFSSPRPHALPGTRIALGRRKLPSHRFTMGIHIFVTTAFVLCWLATGVAESADPLNSAEEVGRAALASNPELEAIEARVRALEQYVPQVGVWPDPMIAVEYSNVPLTTPYPGEHPMSGLQLKVQQTLPAAGKTSARTDEAASRVKAERWVIEERRNQLVGLAQGLYHRLALVRELREITREHVGLVEQLVEVVRAAYEVGRARQHDLLQLEVLGARLTDDLDTFGKQEQEILAHLLATLHRGDSVLIETPAETGVSRPQATLDALMEHALAHHPSLQRLEASARVEALGAARAETEKRPDTTVWLGYRLRRGVDGGDPGEDFLSVGASMPLPWYWNDQRWGSKAQEHRERRRALEATRRARIDAIRGGLQAALARWQRAVQKAERYTTKLVPAAHRTLDATFAAYRVGRADFASVYQAELRLLDFERTIRVARSEAAQAAVEIDTLTGRDTKNPMDTDSAP